MGQGHPVGLAGRARDSWFRGCELKAHTVQREEQKRKGVEKRKERKKAGH